MILVQFSVSDCPNGDSEIKAYLLDDRSTTPGERAMGKSLLFYVEGIIRIIKEEGKKNDKNKPA
jgi:hypothetical protein